MGGVDWVLTILNAKEADEGIYECQVSTEQPLIRRVFLSVEGESAMQFTGGRYTLGSRQFFGRP